MRHVQEEGRRQEPPTPPHPRWEQGGQVVSAAAYKSMGGEVTMPLAEIDRVTARCVMFRATKQDLHVVLQIEALRVERTANWKISLALLLVTC